MCANYRVIVSLAYGLLYVRNDSEGHCPDGLYIRQKYLCRNSELELKVQGAYTQSGGGEGVIAGLYIITIMLL